MMPRSMFAAPRNLPPLPEALSPPHGAPMAPVPHALGPPPPTLAIATVPTRSTVSRVATPALTMMQRSQSSAEAAAAKTIAALSMPGSGPMYCSPSPTVPIDWAVVLGGLQATGLLSASGSASDAWGTNIISAPASTPLSATTSMTTALTPLLMSPPPKLKKAGRPRKRQQKKATVPPSTPPPSSNSTGPVPPEVCPRTHTNTHTHTRTHTHTSCIRCVCDCVHMFIN